MSRLVPHLRHWWPKTGHKYPLSPRMSRIFQDVPTCPPPKTLVAKDPCHKCPPSPRMSRISQDVLTTTEAIFGKPWTIHHWWYRCHLEWVLLVTCLGTAVTQSLTSVQVIYSISSRAFTRDYIACTQYVVYTVTWEEKIIGPRHSKTLSTKPHHCCSITVFHFKSAQGELCVQVYKD